MAEISVFVVTNGATAATNVSKDVGHVFNLAVSMQYEHVGKRAPRVVSQTSGEGWGKAD